MGSPDASGPKILFHLAAKSDVPYCNSHREACFQSNIMYAIQEIEEAVRNGYKAVVLSTTDKVYGEVTKPHGAEEGDPLLGSGIYESSKVAIDVIARSYSSLLPIAVVRCANFIGPDDPHQSRIIPSIINAVNNKTPLKLRGDGSAIRDWLNVDDACAGFVRVAKLLQDNPGKFSGSAWNFSMESPIAIKELVELVCKIHAISSPPVQFGEEIPEIKRLAVCALKARTILDWHPRFSLAQSIEQLPINVLCDQS